MPSLPEVVLLLALGLIALLFQGAAIYLALLVPKVEGGGDPAATGPLPTVSVIVAARNEEEDLGPALDSLLAQEYPGLEILVVDGRSTDRTREVARARGPRVKLVEEPPLPPGWVGKNWGCSLGAQAASGELLLFTDADVVHRPGSVRSAVLHLLREHADLVTLIPRTETRGVWERVVLPFHIQMVLTYFRAPRINRDTSRAAAATGQFLLTTRSAYARVGGHAAVREFVLEDVRLAQLYRAAGLKLRIGWAPELLSTRMYRDRAEMFEGLLKNIHGTEYRLARQVGFLVGLVGFFWLPLGLLPFGLAVGSLPLVAMGALLWIALFGKHVGFTRAVKVPAGYGLLFPVAVGYYVLLVAASIRRGESDAPIEWKGRSYAVTR